MPNDAQYATICERTFASHATWSCPRWPRGTAATASLPIRGFRNLRRSNVDMSFAMTPIGTMLVARPQSGTDNFLVRHFNTSVQHRDFVRACKQTSSISPLTSSNSPALSPPVSVPVFCRSNSEGPSARVSFPSVNLSQPRYTEHKSENRFFMLHPVPAGGLLAFQKAFHWP